MLILIEKDPHTKVPRDVADLDAAKALEEQGFTVHVVNEDNSTTPLRELLTAKADGAEATADADAKPAKGKKAAKADGAEA